MPTLPFSATLQEPTIELRRYQQRVMDEVTEYLVELRREQDANNTRHAAQDAWDAIKERRLLRGVRLAKYGEMKTGDGRDLPNVCLLVPTGGGKTLLATQVIGTALRHLVPEREGGGLVLWLVPTQSIYEQTVNALRDPNHLYYRALKSVTGSRIKVWEKEQMGGLTPVGLRRDLNILVLMLQSVNRRTPTPDEEKAGRKSDFLRYFRDGRVHPAHFPREDDLDAHRRLREGDGDFVGTSNLDVLGDSLMVRTSLANLVRVCRPLVLVDEQQKAASVNARETLAQLNPALLVQLSATPKQSNLLVRVTGKELLQEEMIKLPIAVKTSGMNDWQLCLSDAHREQQTLERAAEAWRETSGKYIRPIAVVQAERTGAKQQDDVRYTHSEDVRTYLTTNLGVPEREIAVRTSERDELKGVDLLDEACPIRWIITRDALREGWDCPFAYLLVSLLASSSLDALTQLVGRVLRQPYQTKTGDERLDRCYVFARHAETDNTLKAVKKSLGDAGLEGDEFVYEEKPGQTAGGKTTVLARLRPGLADNYLAPFPGKILLPRFCVRPHPDSDDWRPLDWYSHLLPGVNDKDFNISLVEEWRLMDALKNARDRYTLLNIEQLLPELRDEAIAEAAIENDHATRAWLTVNVDLPHFSTKERFRVIDRALGRLVEREPDLVGKLALVRYALRDRLTYLIESETDRLAEVQFRAMIAEKRLGFTHLYEPCRYEVPEVVRRAAGRKLRFDDSDPKQAALDFEPEADFNGLEHDFARTADRDVDDVFWWYRNISGEFGIQGWRRRKFYPDFVVQMRYDGKAAPAFLMVETKGAQLDGNLDTSYKRAIADCFNLLGEEIPWQKLKNWERDGDDDRATMHYFQFRILAERDRLEDAWKDEWQKMKEECNKHLRPMTGSATLLRAK